MLIAKGFKTSKKSKKKQTAHAMAGHSSTTPDHAHLTSGHHQAIVATLALLPYLRTCNQSVTTSASPQDQPGTEEEGGAACKSSAGGTGDGHWINLLLVGLGGGALPMFVNKCFPNVS